MPSRKLKKLRDRIGKTQKDIARETGLTRSLIGKIERGERGITRDNVERIADAYEVGPEVIDRIRVAEEEDENGDFVHSGVDFSNWLLAVASSDESPDVRAILSALPLFFDRKSSLAIFTLEEFSEASGLAMPFVERNWEQAMTTDFVRHAHPEITTAIRLTFPESE